MINNIHSSQNIFRFWKHLFHVWQNVFYLWIFYFILDKKKTHLWQNLILFRKKKKSFLTRKSWKGIVSLKLSISRQHSEKYPCWVITDERVEYISCYVNTNMMSNLWKIWHLFNKNLTSTLIFSDCVIIRLMFHLMICSIGATFNRMH